jgi:hypothetical protein
MKHRGFMLALVLLIGGALLIGQHWFEDVAKQPIAVATPPAPDQPVEARLEQETSPRQHAVEAESTDTATPSKAVAGGLRGKVLDAVTRRPVKQFEIRILRWDREANRRLEPITRKFRAETGRFTWSDLPANAVAGSLSAPGYQLFNLGDVVTPTGQTGREVVVQLLAGHAVRGRVFERSTGAGIGGAAIGFQTPMPSNEYRWRTDTKSEDDGSFVLDGVPAGEVTLVIRADDHGMREITIVVDERTPEQQVALSTGGALAGTVTTASGVPVKARVMLFGGSAANTVETDDAGQFSFQHLAAGRYSLAATGPGGGARQTIELGEDERKENLTVAFASGRSVRGVIRGLRLEELEQTYVGIHGQGRSYPSLQARPDAQGAYVINSAPPGRAYFNVGSPSRQLSRVIEVPADRDLTLDIVFAPGVRVSGRITQNGKPTRKSIWLEPAQSESRTRHLAETSEDGQYEFEGVVPGEYRLGSYEEFNRPISVAGDTVANIDIPSVEVGGGVLEDGSAVPITDATIFLRGIETGTSHVHVERTTDDFGQFKLLGLERGEVVLTVYKPGYELYREKFLYATPVVNKKIELRKRAGVEVRAQSIAGKKKAGGFTIVERVPNNDFGVHFWIPLDDDGVGYVPVALAGSDLEYYGAGNKWVVIKEWDGRSFDVRL